ncbi:hypothetical protein CDG81_19290 [Actinopolyspora erythraea]|uniref:Uncharacterized protein n=1 Tax=Actinopolyspora erythraea TaxID=414996 RepID=A0A223RW12_9ACTN|nr:hypothetical protein CDG81_19290 [Actinopolyspora erythraea]
MRAPGSRCPVRLGTRRRCTTRAAPTLHPPKRDTASWWWPTPDAGHPVTVFEPTVVEPLFERLQ